MVSPDLIWTTDVNYWDDCIQVIDMAHNISDILLLSLVRLYWESECDGLSSDLWYLQITFEPPTTERQHYTASIMLQKSWISRSSVEGLCPWQEMLSISWFAQQMSLARWETERNSLKLYVQRQVTQEAMPVGTDRCLSGAWGDCRIWIWS